MTGSRPGQLSVILATGHAAGQSAFDSRDVALCGRPAADWLLDTVLALRPKALSCTGCGAAAMAGLAGARPALRQALTATTSDVDGQPAVTLVLSGRHPLLRPATIRRALRALAGPAGRAERPGVGGPQAGEPVSGESVAGQPAFRAVLVLARGPVNWWSDAPGTMMTAAVAYAGQASGCSQWLAGLDPAGPRALRRRLRDAGAEVVEVEAGPVESLRGDDSASRQLAEAFLYQKIAASWQRRGVIIEDQATTRIGGCVRIGRGTRIRPHTELMGATVIGAGASIGPVTTLLDTTAGDEAVIRYSVCERVSIGEGANIGPFCWLRSGARLGARARAGAFVEVADSDVGDDTQIPHVAAVLGATVGKSCNFAGLSGTAIFDGLVKHRVEIGDHVSIGASNTLIAPVSIGAGACTAAGSVITGDVPGGALAIARARQLNVEGWVAAKLPGSAPALAAHQAGRQQEEAQ